MQIIDKIIGPPIPTRAGAENRVGIWTGIPVFGLDSWSSIAYGPEAILTILTPAGLAASGVLNGITAVLLVLLGLLYFSYRQTINAYPNGGGSYIVAKDNLGPRLGTLAAASLLLDYVLNVAVGISAGIAAVVSVFPALHGDMLPLCLATLLLLTVVNLRGIRSPGVAFFLPTYIFALSVGGVLLWGVARAVAAGGHPLPLGPVPSLPGGTVTVGWWLLIRSFAAGCTAMTGVEAVSNGVPAFGETDRTRQAGWTLTAIIATLAVFLAGVSYLCCVYHIGATSQDLPGYQTVLSQLVGAIVGQGGIYYLTMLATVCVLSLSANTSFADFPRVCQLLARDRFLPQIFARHGRRLVFSTGVVVLALMSGIILVIFGGITDRLIPLFAIGAFGAFTFSQTGMVVHWLRRGKKGSRISLALNSLGATATGLSFLAIVVAKFAEGAWITLMVIPPLYFYFQRTHRDYEELRRKIRTRQPLVVEHLKPPVLVVPIKGWSVVVRNALQFALTLSDVIQCVYVETGEMGAGPPGPVQRNWSQWVEQPLKEQGQPIPELVILKSEVRSIIEPLKQHFATLKERYPDRRIAVVIPELVQTAWYDYLTQNFEATALKAELLFARDPRIVVMNVPTYLDAEDLPQDESPQECEQPRRSSRGAGKKGRGTKTAGKGRE